MGFFDLFKKKKQSNRRVSKPRKSTDSKIKEAFDKVAKDVGQIKAEQKNQGGLIVSKKEIELMIREALLVQAGQYFAPKSEPNKEKNFESIILQKAKKTRPDLIKQAIQGLIERDMRTTDIFNIVVSEKKLCGKTQFYHYLSLVRNELRTGLRPELRTKQRK